MPSITPNGFEKPQAGDPGSIWFPILERNIDRVDQHDHNGTNSELLSPTAILKVSTLVPATGWVVDGFLFKQLVLLPAGFDLDQAILSFRASGGVDDGDVIYPKWQRDTSTQFYLFMPVNDQAVTVLVG